MRREAVAPGRTAGADPAEAWIKEWRRLIPPAGVWWRKSAFDRARARRTNRLRPWRWLTEPVATFRVWLATGRLSPAKRTRWNRRVEAAAAADPLLSALDPHQRRAVVCFEDRAMVSAGAGSGKTRTMVARAGYAVRRLGTPPEAVAFITFTNKATEEIRQRTRARLPGLQVGTIHQLARRVLKLVDRRTVQLSPMTDDEGLRLRRIAGWIREQLDRDPGLAADIALRRNARSAVLKDGEPVERHRIPPDGREVKSYGEVVIGTLLHTAGVPFVYEASFPLPAGKAEGAAGADAPPEDLRGYRPDFYLPDDPEAPVTATGGVWLEHYAHDRRGRAPAEFAGYNETRAWKRRLHESLSTGYVETCFGDLQRAWDGDGPGMAEVLVARLRAAGVEIDDPARWTVEATDDVGDGPDAEPGPLALEVDAWIGAVRRRPPGRPPLLVGEREWYQWVSAWHGSLPSLKPAEQNTHLRDATLAGKFARCQSFAYLEHTRPVVREMVRLRDDLTRLDVHIHVESVNHNHPALIIESCKANEKTLRRIAALLRAAECPKVP